MTTARKTHKASPHTDYSYAWIGTHGTHGYTIRHYQMLSQAATSEQSVTSPMGIGAELYTHQTRTATPNTWRTR
jgi:hypothetical protein